LARKIALIWIILTACFIGCDGPEKIGTKSIGAAKRIDTPAGMIKYLNRQRLPALRTVEPWQNNYGPGLKLTTAHYEVYTTLLEPLMLSQVPGFLESAYRGYNNQLPAPIETTTKFTIYIFGERKQWERFTRSFAPRAARLLSKIKAGAYYMKGACVAYNIGRERTFSTLGHEGWHQFNKRHFQFRLPSWIDEGIAMHFEASRESGGLFYFEPDRNGYRLGALKETLIKNKMIPLKELIAMNPGEALVTSDETVTAFYGQAYALVRFLREEDYGKRLGNYRSLLLDGLRGGWPLSPAAKKVAADRNIPLTTRWNRTVGPELFRQYISGDDLASIEEEYLRFCRKIVYHVRLRPR
jgi:hypothetical protein